MDIRESWDIGECWDIRELCWTRGNREVGYPGREYQYPACHRVHVPGYHTQGVRPALLRAHGAGSHDEAGELLEQGRMQACLGGHAGLPGRISRPAGTVLGPSAAARTAEPLSQLLDKGVPVIAPWLTFWDIG